MKHTVKRILITGDDGYQSPGTRLLARLLKPYFECMIVATKHGMSGVGGALSIRNGGTFGTDTVEGVPALWIDGYPCDAMEFLVERGYGTFDLVLSGINWGMNISGAIVSSGTYSAAIRALHLGHAPHAIAISWFIPAKELTKHHAQKNRNDDTIEDLLVYPGQTAVDTILLAIRNNFWDADILNINLPQMPSKTIRFTKGLEKLTSFFNYPLVADESTGHFSYPIGEFKTHSKIAPDTDTGALLSGYISISPHRKSNLDEALFEKLKSSAITLP